MANKILLKGDGVFDELALDAGVDITPGMLIDRASVTEVKPHDDDGGAVAMPLFALSMEIDGRGIDDDYETDGEAVKFVYCNRGAWVYAWLEDEGNVAAGALLESDGAGALQAYVATTLEQHRAVVRALEAVNNTGGTGPVRIKVEVL